MKKGLFPALLLIAMLMISGISVSFAAGIFPSGVRYEYFSSIQALASNDNSLFIADRNAVYMFDKNGYTETASVIYEEGNIQTVQRPSDIEIFNNILFVLDNDTVNLYDIDNSLAYLGAIQLDYSAGCIAVYPDKDYPSSMAALYAADNTGSFANIEVYTLQISTTPGGIAVGSYFLDYALSDTIPASLYSIKNIVPYYISTLRSGLFYFGENSVYDYSLRTMTSSPVYINYKGSNVINDAIFSPAGNELFCAANGGIFSFPLTGDNQYQIGRQYAANTTSSVRSGKLGSPSKIAAGGSFLYAADNHNGINSLQCFNTANFSFVSNVFCGAGSDDGHFSNPSSVSTAGGLLYVADTTNDRVQIIGKDKISYLEYGFTSPTEIASTIEGGIYVIDSSYTRLLHFDGSRKFVYEFKPDDSRLSDVAVSLDNTVYACDSLQSKIYRRTDGTAGFETILNTDFVPKRIAHSPNKNILYILSATGNLYTYMPGNDAAQYYADFGTTVNDIICDYEGNIFALTARNALLALFKGTSVPVENTPDFSGRNEALGNAVSMHLVKEDSGDGLYSYGDLLIADRAKSAIKIIPAAEAHSLGLRTVDVNDYQHAIDFETAGSFEIMKSDIANTPIYGCPFNSRRITELAKDTKLIVLSMDLSDNDYFSQILYQDKNGVKPAYILKTRLSSLPETAPSFTDGRILNDQTDVYKYPLTNSPILKKDGSEIKLAKSSTITLLPFTKDYFDNLSKEFVKVMIDESTVGYIDIVNIVSKYYMPLTILPVLNARIKTDNVTGAALYELIDGEYVLVTEFTPLKNGTRVHIVGAFDASSDFTEIYYIDSEGHVYHFYIESSQLVSEGLSALQIVAIIMMILIFIILIIILITKRRAFIQRNKENAF